MTTKRNNTTHNEVVVERVLTSDAFLTREIKKAPMKTTGDSLIADLTHLPNDLKITIQGAREHNLKNVDLEFPRNRMVVFTGLSGSGKSSLAFDTLFAEGQRRYVESLSAYARQFLGQMDKPDVDFIEGLSPAVSIDQKTTNRNPRSTVGTTTELYDYLKLLYARIGHTFSPVSGQEVKCYTEDDVAQYILSLPEGSRVAVAAPLQLREGQGVIEKLTLVLGEGILRVHAAGETLPIEDFLPRVDENTRAEDISIVVDRAKVSQDGDLPTRLRDSVARAFSYGNGVCRIVTPEGVKEFSARFEADGIEFEPPTEHLFSFNNPLGACPTCEGYGKIIGIDEDLVIPDKRKTIYEDAVACWRGETMRAWKDQLVANAYKFDFPIHTPFYQLTAEQKRLLWRGNEYFHGLNDFFAYIDSERRKIQFRVMKARYTGKTVCPDCGEPLELTRWVNQGDRRYMTIGTCEEHRKFLVRLKFRKTENDSWSVNRIVYRADDEMEKFYRDKATQSRRRGRGHRRRRSENT